MAFYEFTEEENVVFTGVYLRMIVAGVLMVVVGLALIVFGLDHYSLSLELLLINAVGVILFVIGFLTFRSSKRYKKIVDTQGHDIMYLMEAMADARYVYTLIIALIVIVGVLLLIGVTFTGITLE